ncbi:hypothetical protein [Arthrobacter sp.]|uniref:hypothetical protein n=1 Tax=Arthrobacter sp. TaxID=1667 RepID=UPI003A94CC00
MAECGGALGWIDCKIGDVADTATSSAIGKMAEAMLGGWDSLTKGFLTSWLDVGLLVDLDAGSVAWLTAQLQVISILLATVGLMVAALWTMIHHRGEKMAKVIKSMFTVVLVSTAGVGLMQVVLVGGDAFSTWILDSAGVTVDGRGSLPVAALVASSPGLAILAGIFGIIATIIQWGIMLVRSALLPLLVGVWPVAAAASMIGGAEQAFSKITTWIIAFTIYKPVAAIVYAYAWKTKSGEDGIGGVINGLILIVLAVVALPAIMRLVSPGTSAMGGSGGGGMALAGGAALVGAGVAAGTAILSGGGSVAAGGAVKTAGTAKSTQAASTTGTSTAKGTGNSGPPTTGDSGTGDSGSGGGSPAAGNGSGGTGSGTVGGESTAGGTGSETTGADDPAGAAGSTGSGTVGGDTAAGGTGSETVGADGGASGAGGTAAGTMGGDSAAQGTSGPTSADSGTSESSGTAGGSSAPTGAPEATPAQPNTNKSPSKAKEAGSAAARSMGQAIADGTRDADGKDVIGE